MNAEHYSRRAGRLLTLDRGVKHAESWREQQRAEDGLDAARGIVHALALGVLLWACVAGLAWWTLGILAQ